jgi:ribose transport system ATP-binding protein
MIAPVLETRLLGKTYPGTRALDRVSLAFEGGRVAALVGRNGAGKSTLVKILSGAVPPSDGEVLLDGRSAVFRSPGDAKDAGIATVHQELSLVPGLSAAENILFGRFPRRRGLAAAAIDWRKLNETASQMLSAIGVPIDPRETVSRLSLAQQQVLEIARAVHAEARVILLDEPSSGLSRSEVEMLFRLVRTLAGRGVAVVYVTHRLAELAEIADTVTAFRDGRHVGTIPASEASPARLVELMFGETAPGSPGSQDRQAGGAFGTRAALESATASGAEGPVAAAEPRAESPAAPAPTASRPPAGAPAVSPALEVRGLTLAGRLHDIAFTLGRGEILGIAGMLGSGRTETLSTIVGALRADGGEIVVHGPAGVRTLPASRTTPRIMRSLGVALVPENRQVQGLVAGMSVLDNICLASLGRIARGGVITRALQRRAAAPLVRDLEISAPSLDAPVSALSGGNQQKVVIAKWLARSPRVMLFDEPTRGIDVQAKAQVFGILRGLAASGIGSIVVSSELEELLDVCHRIVVIRHGRIVGEASPEGLSLDGLLSLCMEA